MASKKWTAQQELSLAHTLREHETQALELIEAFDIAIPILAERGNRVEITNAAAISRLIRATEAVFSVHKKARSKTKRLTARTAMQHMKAAEALRWKLAMSAYYIAIAEARKRSGNEEGQQELAQVGTIGLLDAATRFDPKRKLRFTTYARWWVIARMTRHTNPFPVNVSPNFIEKRMRVTKTIARLERTGIDWTLEELAYHAALTVAQTRKVLDHPLLGVSLSTPVYDSFGDREKLLIDDLVDETSIDPGDSIHQSRREHWLKTAVEMLSNRQKYVITARYGLEDGTWRTLSQVGQQLSLSRERVRQIEAEAFILLRDLHPPGFSGPQDSKPEVLAIPSDDQVLAVLKVDEQRAKSDITKELFGNTADVNKQHTLNALKRLESQGFSQRSGHGMATKWSKAQPTATPPPKNATWKERIQFDLGHHPWSTSGEIAGRLSERDRLNSLSATLGLLCQSGAGGPFLQRRRAGRTFQYSLIGALATVE